MDLPNQGKQMPSTPMATASSSSSVGIGGALINMANQWMNNVFNAKQAQKARDWQEDFYNKYQTPSALVKQYKDAGINPASVFGNMNLATPPSGSSAASAGVANVGDALNFVLQMKQMNMQSKLIDSQIEKNEADAGLTRSQTGEQDTRNKYIDTYYDLVNKFTDKQIDSLISQIDVNGSIVRLNDSQVTLNGSQEELNYASRILTNLNSANLQKMLLYVDELNTTEIALKKAATEQAKQTAYKQYCDALSNMLEHGAEDGIFDGLFSSERIKQYQNIIRYSSSSVERNYRLTPIKSIAGSVRDLGLGVGTLIKAFKPFPDFNSGGRSSGNIGPNYGFDYE